MNETIWTGNNFFTADLHLGHANIIKYLNRPFMTGEEQQACDECRTVGLSLKPIKLSDETCQRHNDTIINNINSVVGKDDILWVLGDFAFGRTREEIAQWLRRINCHRVRLIKGNHDSRESLDLFGLYPDMLEIWVQNQPIVMCHYAMRTWNKSHYGSWHLYGHSHGQLPEDQSLSFDVGVDAHDFKPWSFEEIAAKMQQKAAMRCENS